MSIDSKCDIIENNIDVVKSQMLKTGGKQKLTLERQTEINERLCACDAELDIIGQIERVINNHTLHDMSVLIYSLFKDKFACCDTKMKKKVWHIFENNCWRVDDAKSLYTLISTFIADVFYNEIDKLNVLRASLTVEDEIKINAVKCKGIYQIVNDCKTVKSKSIWIVECKTLFYNPKLIEIIDTNNNKIFLENFGKDFINIKDEKNSISSTSIYKWAISCKLEIQSSKEINLILKDQLGFDFDKKKQKHYINKDVNGKTIKHWIRRRQILDADVLS